MSRFIFLFAVVHEARPFVRRLRNAGFALEKVWYKSMPFVEPAWTFQAGEIWITGMGQRNAAATMKAILCSPKDIVLTCGFAGALSTELSTTDVLFHADPDMNDLEMRLRLAGAQPARFACEPRVVVSSREKLELRIQTGADAVEMESGTIREICRSRGIRSATVRVISDDATEDLPLDFNGLMTPDMRIDGGRLALQLVAAPWKVAELLRFQKRVKKSAESLAEVLLKALPDQLKPNQSPA